MTREKALNREHIVTSFPKENDYLKREFKMPQINPNLV